MVKLGVQPVSAILQLRCGHALRPEDNVTEIIALPPKISDPPRIPHLVEKRRAGKRCQNIELQRVDSALLQKSQVGLEDHGRVVVEANNDSLFNQDKRRCANGRLTFPNTQQRPSIPIRIGKCCFILCLYLKEALDPLLIEHSERSFVACSELTNEHFFCA